jgi:hypothetical protein
MRPIEVGRTTGLAPGLAERCKPRPVAFIAGVASSFELDPSQLRGAGSNGRKRFASFTAVTDGLAAEKSRMGIGMTSRSPSRHADRCLHGVARADTQT